MDKHAVLILAHNDISHIFKYADLNPSANFYIHMDSKTGPIKYNKYPKNVYFLPDYLRHSIIWAGFSMVEASNDLFKYALENKENTFFHLISGTDVILQKLNDIEFNNNTIYMDFVNTPQQRYRVRFNTPHADTLYQRSALGKALTLAYKFIDKIVPTTMQCFFGSQWFSIHRKHLETIMMSADNAEVNAYFRKKLCPDEHYYQYLIHLNKLEPHLSNEGNKRYIIFDKDYNNSNNPIFLDLAQVSTIDKKKYWFARKVEPSVINSFLAQEKN